MGYYINTMKTNFVIKKENFDDAYNALCALNANDSIKRGGRWSNEKSVKPSDSKSISNNPDKWFSWMIWNYDEVCTDLAAVLEMLGFDVFFDADGNINDIYYDNKSGQENIFLDALAAYVEDGSYILWHGEDDEMWVSVFENGNMTEEEAHITW